MKGFTLLELIIVIIIVGVLATLGFTQYGAMIEKSRGGEARQTISTLRSHLTAKNYEGLGAVTITNGNLGIVSGMVPPSCVAPTISAIALMEAARLRCVPLPRPVALPVGKILKAFTTGTLRLFFTNTGTDTWSSTAGY